MRNKKKILKFLIPVEANLNNFPTKVLLSKYQLNEYQELMEACQIGDMVRFEQTLQVNMDHFVQGGVYMVVDRLRHLTLRNLVKKVALVVQREADMQVNSKPNIIRLEYIYNILKEWDSMLDLDEVECLLANLIHLGKIRAYISHE